MSPVVVIVLGLLLAVAVGGAGSRGGADRDVAATASGAERPDHEHGGGLVAGPPVVQERANGARAVMSFTASPVGSDATTAEVRENGFVDLRLAVTDPTTGGPLGPASRPVVWVDRQKSPAPGGRSLSCEDKARLYARGTFGFKPEIDLNAYYILTLNADASISVIDPMGGVSGISQLYAMVFLKSPGEDWVADADSGRIFVSMPEVGQVAVVDTETFEVVDNVDVGGTPVRLALQPEGRRLWVGDESDDPARSGVTVVDTHELEVVATIPTGPGAHDILIPDPRTGKPGDGHGSASGPHGHDGSEGRMGRHVFVTNSEGGSVSVIDTGSLEKVWDADAGRSPVAVAHAGAADAVYVGDGAGGLVTSIDATTLETRGRTRTWPGLTDLGVAPGGRWAFAVNSTRDSVDVLDTTTNRVVHTVRTGPAPDRVFFSEGSAYVRSTGTSQITVIDLHRLGRTRSLPAVKVIGGQKPPGAVPDDSVADALVAHHGHQVLIANPADNYVYDYMEGMNSPMGGFKNYGPAARAVHVVDRGLRETAPGVFEARVKVSEPGTYQVAVVLGRQRMLECFAFTAVPKD